MTGDSAVTSISERSTYSVIFFRLGLVPSIRNLRKFTQPSLMRMMEWMTDDVEDHQRLVDVHLEIAAGAAEAHRDIVAHHLHGEHRERFALGRIDLARHDRGARLVFRNR